MTNQKFITMSKSELMEHKKFYTDYLNQIDELLSNRGQELTLKNKQAPFRQWSISEKNELYNIMPSAFDWLQHNPNSTIDDYNAQAQKSSLIYLAN